MKLANRQAGCYLPCPSFAPRRSMGILLCEARGHRAVVRHRPRLLTGEGDSPSSSLLRPAVGSLAKRLS